MTKKTSKKSKKPTQKSEPIIKRVKTWSDKQKRAAILGAILLVLLVVGISAKIIGDNNAKEAAKKQRKFDKKIELIIEDSYSKDEDETEEGRIVKLDQALEKYDKKLSKKQKTAINLQKARLMLANQKNDKEKEHQIIDQVLELDLACSQIGLTNPIMHHLRWQEDKYKLKELYQKELKLLKKCQASGDYENLDGEIYYYQNIVDNYK